MRTYIMLFAGEYD